MATYATDYTIRLEGQLDEMAGENERLHKELDFAYRDLEAASYERDVLQEFYDFIAEAFPEAVVAYDVRTRLDKANGNKTSVG